MFDKLVIAFDIFIQTEEGDTVDCIDIDKQLSLEHPLLKNHKIQVKIRQSFRQQKKQMIQCRITCIMYSPVYHNCFPFLVERSDITFHRFQ